MLIAHRLTLAALAFCLSIQLVTSEAASANDAQQSSVPQGWPSPIRKAAVEVTPSSIAAHTRFLSHDLLEGRGPGTRGDELGRAYIASVYERLGLEPAGDSGTYFQWFDIVGITSAASGAKLTGKSGTTPLTLEPGKNAVIAAGDETPSVRVDGSEVIFVGYGISAPEEKWDDFKGLDVKGKVLLVMNNDPSQDPKRFGGKTRLYYGRWTYKFEEAARRGAKAAIIIHTNESAGYPWQVVQTSWSGEQFNLPKKPNEPRLPVQMWVTEETAKSLASLGGQDLDALRKQAESDAFRPVSLGVRFSAEVTARLHKERTANVLGRLPGRDPVLAKEQVIFTAHHDHLGMGEAKGGDKIYNGALDNASGVAMMLSVAEAIGHAGHQPKRSLLFAAVGAEESGLLGSEYLCGHLPVPAKAVAANLNVDGINIWGRTRDVTLLGLGKTSIDGVLTKLAAGQKRTVKKDAFPDRGFYYRSDQFNFARIGIPAVNLSHGLDFIGQAPDWGRKQVEAWEQTHYHQPSDQIVPAWNLVGAAEDAQLLLATGITIADANQAPTWASGDEFERVRKQNP